jgi:chemotaxis protein CheC
MMSAYAFHEIQIDALREVANIGAGHAATALSQMTGARIDVSVPNLQVTSRDRVPAILGEEDAVIAAVLVHVLGDLTGRTVLVLPIQAASRLAEILLHRELGAVGDFDELERSALMEVGNILSAAYMNALSDFLGMMLLPSVPHLSINRASELVSTVSSESATEGEYAFSIETRFTLRGSDPVSGQFIFLPALASLRTLLDALRLS